MDSIFQTALVAYAGFTRIAIDGTHSFFIGRLPDHLIFTHKQFDELWDGHPTEYHLIKIHGRLVKTPRWQQAYGADYHYTGRVNKALPVPPLLDPIYTWCNEAVFPRLNGLLLNWYDATLDHYIGKHRDSTTNMIEGAPIVTISLGEQRDFRLRPWKGKGFRDFPATHGTVFIMPYETNLAWTHEVPHAAKYTGRRISITARAFESGSRSAP